LLIVDLQDYVVADRDESVPPSGSLEDVEFGKAEDLLESKVKEFEGELH
jgi:hypothetical protein